MEKREVHILMKILSEESHCENMLNGNILFSPFSKFNNIKDEHVRGDRYDGQEYVLDPRNTEVKIGDMLITGMIDKILCSKQSVLDNNKICSFYLLEAYIDYTAKYDERINNLGNFCVVITNPQEFIDRIEKIINKIYPSTFQYDLVDYVNMENIDEFYGKFKKPDEYSWQNEYRMCFTSNKTGTEFINMGGINDIAVMYKLDDFLKHFKCK